MSEIYDGEMCIRDVQDWEVLGIGLVDEPVQKYSVIFPNGDDDERLALVKYVASALNSPWDAWDYRKEERRQYHPAFQNLGAQRALRLWIRYQIQEMLHQRRNGLSAL